MLRRFVELIFDMCCLLDVDLFFLNSLLLYIFYSFEKYDELVDKMKLGFSLSAFLF
jgi:hypothetical protein